MAGLKPTELTATLRCKVVVCGDAAVGKSALISMFTSKGQTFPKDYIMTTGVAVSVGQLQIPDTTVLVEMFVVDTPGNAMTMIAGTDSNKDALGSYWTGAYYSVLVYDVSNPESYESCKQWLEELKKARPDKDRPLKAVLVATKSDLPSQRHLVQSDVAKVWANANGLDFFTVSSVLPGDGVEAPFMNLAKAFHKNYEEKLSAFHDACAHL